MPPFTSVVLYVQNTGMFGLTNVQKSMDCLCPSSKCQTFSANIFRGVLGEMTMLFSRIVCTVCLTRDLCTLSVFVQSYIHAHFVFTNYFVVLFIWQSYLPVELINFFFSAIGCGYKLFSIDKTVNFLFIKIRVNFVR